MLLIMVGASKC